MKLEAIIADLEKSMRSLNRGIEELKKEVVIIDKRQLFLLRCMARTAHTIDGITEEIQCELGDTHVGMHQVQLGEKFGVVVWL